MSESESKSALVLELAEEFLERYRQGQRPSLKEYIDRHPELAVEIKEVFPAMALMENIALADESLAGDPTGEATATAQAPPEQLGDFRILREVGRGGMGIVYEAEQLSLGRHVALKVLPRKVLLDAQQKRRFEREAKAAAKLHHTNIVPVFGVGEQDGLPYYVMQFIQGMGLDQVLEELQHLQGRAAPAAAGAAGITRADVSVGDMARSLLTGAFPPTLDSAGGLQGEDEAKNISDTGKLSGSLTASPSLNLPGADSVSGSGKGKKSTYWQSVARIGVQVADALEYAHKQGIQHRDIKPSNLLLDTRGTVWVTDFGLARADNEDHLTQTGDIVGTLRYMPPEAFEGRSDARGDLYSLGLTLYELLVLRPAFEEKIRHKLIKRVTTEEPARLNKLNRSMPRDLVTIIHKAIDREPPRRYQTAGELAADLQRFLDDEPIQARRLNQGERLGRWCRRHPGVAGLALLLLLVFWLGFAGVAWQWRRAESTAENERLARGRAERAEKVATRTAAAETAARRDAEEARGKEAEQRRRAEAARGEAERQQRQAENNFRQARQAVDDYLTRVSENRLLRVPGMQPLRKELLQSALQYYQGFLKQRGQDPALRKDLAAAYLRMADITAEIDSPTEALTLCDKAREVLQDLQRLDPQSDEVRLNLVACHQTAGQLHRRLGKLDAALQSCQQAYRILLEVSPQDANRKASLTRTKGATANGIRVHSSPDTEMLSRFFRSLNDTGLVYQQMGELGAALYRYDQALLIQQSLVRDHPRHARIVSFQHGLAGQLDRLGRLQGEIGMYAQARAYYKEARDILERLLREHPRHENAVDFQRDLAASLESDGDVLTETGQLDAALSVYENALPLRQRLARENPAVLDYQNDLARNYYRMSLLHIRANQPAGALPLLQQAIEHQRGLVEAMPEMNPYVRVLSRQLGKLGSVQRQLGKTAEAGQSYQEARTLLEKLPPVQADDFYELALWRTACGGDAGLALQALRQAIQAGYADLDRLEKDAELAPLRSRQEFQKLLEDVRRKTKILRWTDDFEAARIQAAKENKDLFLWFGSSDWAPLDAIQRKTRFERAAFIDYAAKHFVMVDLDWPVYKTKPKNYAKRMELARKWQITGIPYAVLADAQGRPYGIQGGDRQGTRSLEALLKELEQERQIRVRRDQLLAQAAASKGLEKARLLDRALRIVSSRFALDYPDEIAEILDLDRENQAGLRSKYLPWAARDWLTVSRKILVLRQKQLASDPKNKPLQADLADSQQAFALMQLDLGKLDEAGKHLKQAVVLREALLREEPENARYQTELKANRLWVRLAHARRLAQLKHNKEAETVLAKMEPFQPDSPKMWKERGRVYFEKGQTEKAAADFRKAVELLGDKVLSSEPAVSEADKLFARLADDALLKPLTAAIERSPENIARRWQRGDWYARHGQWKEAVADYTIALQRTPNDAERWLHAAPVWIAAGDRDDYRRRCREMHERFADTQDLFTAERTAKACLLLSELAKETEWACQLADRAVARGKNHPLLYYFVFCKGLADYRRENFAAVVAEIEPLLPSIASVTDLTVMCHMVLAMALHRQGDAKAAREHLREGVKLLKQHLPDLASFHMEISQYRHDWLIAWLLHREAQTLIEGVKDEPKKQ